MSILDFFKNIFGPSCSSQSRNVANIKGNGNIAIQDSVNTVILNDAKYVTINMVTKQAGLDKMPDFVIAECTDEPIDAVLVEPYSKRRDMVECCSSILREKYCLNIYGGVLTGKSALCDLIAAQFPEYQRVKVDASHLSEVLISSFLHDVTSKVGNRIIILDNCPSDLKVRDGIIRAIVRNCNEKALILSNSTGPFNPNSVSDHIQDIYASSLTLNELREMLPEEFDEKKANFIHTVCNGQLALIHIACIWLANRDWNFDMDAFSKIMSVSKDESLQTRLYQTISQTIPDLEDVRLLNRLLLLDGLFTSDDCKMMAAPAPAISAPLMRLTRLSGNWISKSCDGKFVISEIVRKALSPDLNKEELRLCTNIVVDQILAKGELTPNDALRIILLTNQAEEYARLTAFYISLMFKLNEQNLLDSPVSGILGKLWTDMPLPYKMSKEQKALMRISRIIVDPKFPDVPHRLIKDLEDLSGNLSEQPLLQYLVVMILEIYYAHKHQYGELLAVRKFAQSEVVGKLPQFSTNIDMNLNIDQFHLPIFALHGAKTIEELIGWFDVYKAFGAKTDPYVFECMDVTLSRLSIEMPREDMMILLEKMYKRCSLETDDAFIKITALITFHHMQLLAYDPESAMKLYETRIHLTSDILGCFRMNAGIGIVLSENKDDRAADFLERALAVDVHDFVPMLYFRTACLHAQVMSPMNPKLSFERIIGIANTIKDHEGLFPHDKVVIGLCVAYAAYMAGFKDISMKALVDASVILFELTRDDEFKKNSTHLAIVIDTIRRHEEPGDSRDFVDATYFSPFICPSNLDSVYNSQRLITSLVTLLRLSDKIGLEFGFQMTILDMILNNFDEFAEKHGEFLMFTVPFIPVLLANGEKDIADKIVALIDVNEAHIMNWNEACKKSMLQFLGGIPLYYALVNLDCSSEKEPYVCPLFTRLQVSDGLVKSVMDKISTTRTPKTVMEIAFDLYGLGETYWSVPSSMRILSLQIKTMMEQCAKEYPAEITEKYSSLSNTFRKIKDPSSSKEYIRRLLQGMSFHLKNDSYLGTHILTFLNS